MSRKLAGVRVVSIAINGIGLDERTEYTIPKQSLLISWSVHNNRVYPANTTITSADPTGSATYNPGFKHFIVEIYTGIGLGIGTPSLLRSATTESYTYNYNLNRQTADGNFPCIMFRLKQVNTHKESPYSREINVIFIETPTTP